MLKCYKKCPKFRCKHRWAPCFICFHTSFARESSSDSHEECGHCGEPDSETPPVSAARDCVACVLTVWKRIKDFEIFLFSRWIPGLRFQRFPGCCGLFPDRRSRAPAGVHTGTYLEYYSIGMTCTARVCATFQFEAYAGVKPTNALFAGTCSPRPRRSAIQPQTEWRQCICMISMTMCYKFNPQSGQRICFLGQSSILEANLLQLVSTYPMQT